MRPRLSRAALPVILVIALALRLGAMAATDPYFPQWDAIDYHAHALSLAEHGKYPGTLFAGLDEIVVRSDNQPPTIPARTTGPSAYRPPTYPYLLGAVYLVSNNSWTAGRLTNALLGVLAVALVFLIARRLWDRTLGLVAAGLMAVAPPLVYLSSSLMSEPLFIALELAAVLAVIVHGQSDHRLRWLVAAGVLCGLCALTRANGLLLIPVAALGVWAYARAAGRPALKPVAVLVAVSLLTIAPWTIRNALVMDRFVPISTQAGTAIGGSYNELAERGGLREGWIQPLAVPEFQREVFKNKRFNEADVERELRRRGTSFALDHPGYALATTWWNSLRMFELADLGRYRDVFQQERALAGIDRDLSRIGTYVLALLALGGAVVLLTGRPGRRGAWFVWLLAALLFLSTVPLNGSPRYRAPLDPWLVLLAAAGVVEGARRLSGRRASTTYSSPSVSESGRRSGTSRPTAAASAPAAPPRPAAPENQ